MKRTSEEMHRTERAPRSCLLTTKEEASSGRSWRGSLFGEGGINALEPSTRDRRFNQSHHPGYRPWGSDCGLCRGGGTRRCTQDDRLRRNQNARWYPTGETLTADLPATQLAC